MVVERLAVVPFPIGRASSRRGLRKVELAHLLGYPVFEIFQVYRRQVAEVGSQTLGPFGVDMVDFALLFRRIPLDQNPNASV